MRETEKKGTRELTDLFSKVRWGRVLLAGLVTHVANVVVAVLLIVVYTLVAVGPQREPSGASQIRSPARSLLGLCPS